MGALKKIDLATSPESSLGRQIETNGTDHWKIPFFFLTFPLRPCRYMGWKPTREEVAKEFAKNRALGEKLSCWKAGMLVDNDQGDVAAALKEMEGTKQ